MFSNRLQQKIDQLKALRTPIQLGKIHFDSKLLLAPMAGICNAPFRLLMEELGAGGTVSELISCHGINYGNRLTREMLRIDPREKNVGIQLFGEDAEAMARAAKVACEFGPKFIDINMGCPVRKVVTKGGGSALMKETATLGNFFTTVKKAIEVPLSIKIRTGWDVDQINADEIIRIAKESGIEWVAVHGRTRAQQYTGQANWEYLEWLASDSPLPLIGNGDLHLPSQVHERLKVTQCQALMLARGPLRDPFIFLESLDPTMAHAQRSHFNAQDYWEVGQVVMELMKEAFAHDPRTQLVQARKLLVWFSSGFHGAAHYRSVAFASQDLSELEQISREFFDRLQESTKHIPNDQEFMTSGHG